MQRTYHIDVPDHVENEQAYVDAANARINANRIKGARKRWLAAHEDAQDLSDWLFGVGNYAHTLQMDPLCSVNPDDGYPEHRFELDGKDYRCKCERITHPLAFYTRGEFLDKMRDALDEWGGLTDNQTAAVRKCLQRAQEKLHENAIRRSAQLEADRNSKHVGILSTRREFVLTCDKVFSFDGQYGTSYINICRDQDGNIIVYKGSNGWTKGETLTVVATVKAHDERDGVAQTIIARPTIKQ
jgi:hypothetical protein